MNFIFFISFFVHRCFHIVFQRCFVSTFLKIYSKVFLQGFWEVFLSNFLKLCHRFFHRVLNFEIFSKFRLCKIHRFFHRLFSCDRVFHIFLTVFSQVFIQYWKYPILGHEKLTPVHKKFRVSVQNIYKIYTIMTGSF